MTEPAASPAPSVELRAAAPDLARRFGLVLGGLCTAIGLSVRGADASGKALAELAWKHAFRMRHRLEALLVRIAAGWLPRPRPATPRPAPVAPPDPAAPRRTRVCAPALGRLPRGHACLIRVVGYRAAGFASQLQHLLADPAMAEIVANVPSFGRMLRPLCQVLGIAPPVLGFPPPPPPRPARPPKATKRASAEQSAISAVYAALRGGTPPAPEPVREPTWPWLVPRPVWRIP
jgi:hypothetical protein